MKVSSKFWNGGPQIKRIIFGTKDIKITLMPNKRIRKYNIMQIINRLPEKINGRISYQTTGISFLYIGSKSNKSILSNSFQINRIKLAKSFLCCFKTTVDPEIPSTIVANDEPSFLIALLLH
jgi:hypothetical protein